MSSEPKTVLEADAPQDPARPDIRSRSFSYALRAVRLYQFLQRRKDGAGWVLGKQYLRAACSIGANVAEAQSAESRLDFIHKLGIAQKEGRESLYWLRLIAESRIVPRTKLKQLMGETEAVIAIITAIIVSCKRKTVSKSRNSELRTQN
jgi:four helix bundle protein